MYFTFILILALLVFGIFQIDIVKERVETEWFIIPSILSGDITKIPYTSMGARFHFWYESIDWIKSHPIAGLGHEARSLVISTSERLPDYIKANFSHLHSGHIEMLVNYGILGYLNFYCYATLL
ncbi:O-antigen ligase family protein [Vibrio taketomensis]|uniref:O-antigen ligase family protein n=1 Tax=Vibrio taketomensis TaxID=2572923 RepID=UPI0038CDB45C